MNSLPDRQTLRPPCPAGARSRRLPVPGEPSVRARLVALVLSVLGPALLAFGLGSVHAWRAGVEAAEATLRARAEALAAAVGRELDTARATLLILAGSPHLAAGDLGRFHAQLAATPPSADARIVLADESGQMLVTSLLPFGTPLPKRGDLEVVARLFATGEPQVSNLHTGSVTREPLITMDVPVRDGGRVVYDLNMGLPAAMLGRVVAEQRLPEDWIGTILDGRGSIVARSRAAEAFTGSRVADTVLAAIASGENLFTSTSQEGWAVRAAHARVPGTPGWATVVAVPERRLMAPLRRSLILLAVGGGGLLLLGLGAALWHARRITAPIAALSAGAAALARGGLPPAVPHGVQEATRVGAALHRAAEALRERESEREAAVASLRESEARLRVATEANGVGTWELVPGAGAAVTSPRHDAIFGYEEPIGRWSRALLLAHVAEEDRAAVDASLAEAVSRGRTWRCEARIRLRRDGPLRWIELHGYPVPEGGRVRFVGVVMDVTERRENAERERLLAREVDHRAKNMLAVVQATLKLTRAESIAEFVRAVGGRIGALARAQTQLAAGRWSGADLRRLVEEEILPFAAEGRRVTLDGPQVVLPAQAAQPLAMALHELATNAARHGALSVPQGRVSVSWRLEGGPGGEPEGRLLLRWAELGGPPVPGPPGRRGFGFRMLEATLRGQLGGDLAWSWPVDGLVCEMTLCLHRPAGEGDAG